jgi:hypothetical protein
MNKLSPGIYRLDGELANPELPLIVMHPWYQGKDLRSTTSLPKGKIAQVVDSPTDNYYSNIDSLLRAWRGPIVLFEEIRKVCRSAERLAAIAGTKGRYVIPTEPDSCSPAYQTKGTFGGISKFLVELRGGEIALSGGYMCTESDKRWGCLGVFSERMEQLGVHGDFVEGCCFG